MILPEFFMSNKHLTLAVDNSLDFLNLALGEDNILVEERHGRAENRSSEVIAIRVNDLLKDHGYTPASLSHIIVSLGPGSFTGVRVSLAFCKGLAQGLDIPITGVPTPDVLASALIFMDDDCFISPLIDAKKGEVFFALYKISSHRAIFIDGYFAVKPDDLVHKIPPACFCLGSGSTIYRSILESIENVTVLADNFNRVIGERLLRCGLADQEGMTRYDLKPIYGRRSEAEIKFGLDLS
jgi:tRNA threonylcarbamoyladenosine biosynthesis protein TsaB